jgi:hypothetical protein
MENLRTSTLATRKKTILVLFLIFFSLLTKNSFAQPSITWQRYYDNGSRGNNEGRDICSSTPGTYFVVGRSYSIPNSTQVIKINDNGDSLWNKFYPTVIVSPEACLSVENGGCILVGYGNGRVKLDSDGNIIWNKDSTGMEAELFEVIKTSDNNYIACGSALTPIQGYVVKFDSTGNVIWHKFYPASSYLRFFSITESYSSGYIIGGVINEGTFSGEAFVINIDGNGNEIWRKKPMPSSTGKSCNTVRKFQNKYVAVGSSDTINIVKMDLDGSTIFHKRLPRPIGASSSITTDGRGELYKNGLITYKNYGSTTGIFSVISKLDSIFDVICTLRVQYIFGDCVLYNSMPLPNSDIFLTGIVELDGWGHNNFYVIRADSNLNSPLITIQQISSILPQKSALINNYPNPFNPSTNITFEIKEAGIYSIKIYNLLGKEVEELTNHHFSPGTYKIIWQAEKFSSGIYFCFMESKDIKSTLKLTLIK